MKPFALLIPLALFASMGCAMTTAVAMTEDPPANPPEQEATKNDSTTQKKKNKMLTWENLNIEEKSPERKDKLVLTEEEWRKRLTPEQFRILRSHGTDPAFCGRLEDHKEEGKYHCGGCDLPLFVSSTKFHSGTGWPSFYLPYDRQNVWFRTDRSYGMVRVEVLCAKCDGHLGHAFPDGPKPSGVRFCINGSALKFKAEKLKEKSPEEKKPQ